MKAMLIETLPLITIRYAAITSKINPGLSIFFVKNRYKTHKNAQKALIIFLLRSTLKNAYNNKLIASKNDMDNSILLFLNLNIDLFSINYL